jgi:hypothetical protein
MVLLLSIAGAGCIGDFGGQEDFYTLWDPCNGESMGHVDVGDGTLMVERKIQAGPVTTPANIQVATTSDSGHLTQMQAEFCFTQGTQPTTTRLAYLVDRKGGGGKGKGKMHMNWKCKPGQDQHFTKYHDWDHAKVKGQTTGDLKIDTWAKGDRAPEIGIGVCFGRCDCAQVPCACQELCRVAK